VRSTVFDRLGPNLPALAHGGGARAAGYRRAVASRLPADDCTCRRDSDTCGHRPRQLQAPMRSVLVVMINELMEHAFEVPRVQNH